ATAWPFSRYGSLDQNLRRQADRPRAQLARGGRQRQDARPDGDADRGRPAGQAQAGVHAPHRHGRLRGGGERREGACDREQAQGQALLPPLGLPRRAALADLRGDAPEAPRGDHQARGQGDDAAEPARAKTDHEAQDLRRTRAPACRAEAPTDGDRGMMADEETPETPEGTPDAPEQSEMVEPSADRSGIGQQVEPEAERDEAPVEEIEVEEIAAVAEDAQAEAPGEAAET